MTSISMFVRRYRTHFAVVAANALFAAIFVAVALSGFHRPTPHHLPVGIVAPASVTDHFQRGLNAHAPGAISLEPLKGAPGARAAVEQHDVDAAVIVTPQRLQLLTAEAGGTASTITITTAITALAAGAGHRLTVSDIVAPGRDDSQALSSFFLILCVLFPSLATGIAAGHALRRTRLASRVAVLVAVAGIAGLAAAGAADAISRLSPYWAIAGIVALFSLAVSASAAALAQIAPALAGLAVLAFLVFGIPVSGGPPNLAAFAPHYLRWLAPGLPLGAAVTTMRDTVYFHAAHTTTHLWVLTAYAISGIAVLCGLAATAGRRRERQIAQDTVTAASDRAPQMQTAAFAEELTLKDAR